MAYQDYYALPGGDMPTPDLDQQRLDDAFRDVEEQKKKLKVTQIPGLAAGSITGVHGIASPSLGLWSATAFPSDQPDQSANVTRKTTDKSSEALHAGESQPGLEARSGDSLGATLAADTARDNAANISSGTPDQRDDRTPPENSGAPRKLYDYAPTKANMPGILGNTLRGFNNWIDVNRPTMLALAGGLAGAQSLGQGLGRAFTGAAQMQPFVTGQRQANQTAQALVNRANLPPDLALAVARNPQALTGVLSTLAGGNNWEFKTIKGEYGQDIPVLFNPRTTETRPINFGGGVGGGSGGGVAPGGMPTNVNHDLPSEQFMAQFPEPVRAAAQAWLDGDVMPSGNPRMQSIASFGKNVAQEYAMKRQQEGRPIDASDNAYNAKRKMWVDLNSSSNSSVGGILSNGKSAFGHLAELGEAFVNQNSASGPNIPGGSFIGQGENFIQNPVGSLSGAIGKACRYARCSGSLRPGIHQILCGDWRRRGRAHSCAE
jgi:hypothetical protein